jgi:hypothetical protein
MMTSLLNERGHDQGRPRRSAKHAFGHGRLAQARPARATLGAHHDQVDRARVGVQGDDVGRIAVLLHRLRGDAGVLGALQKFR